MNTENKMIVGIILLWLFGVILSIGSICGIIWFALWAAKQFGIL